MNRIYHILTSIAVLFIFLSCGNTEKHLILRQDDLKEQKIALQKGTLSEDEMRLCFPESEFKAFYSTSEILLALSSGKFDAAVLPEGIAKEVILETKDFELLDIRSSEIDSISVIVHKSRTPGRNISDAGSGGFVEKSATRIKESLLERHYGEMILWGFLITISIFCGSWLLAMSIAVLMTLLGFVQKLKFIWKPLMFFIKTIHDVPSIVLIFFFYYIVFANSNIDGILACIVALGVYGSGSFSNIIQTHIKQVDPLQHKAAEMLGLKGWKKYRLVILPQTVGTMLPFFLSESKVLLRATTYAGYISILDIVKVTEMIRSKTYDALVPLIFVSIVFLILSWLIKKALYLSYDKLFANDRS